MFAEGVFVMADELIQAGNRYRSSLAALFVFVPNSDLNNDMNIPEWCRVALLQAGGLYSSGIITAAIENSGGVQQFA